MEHPHTPLSSSAKAEDPVRRGLLVLSSASLEYWIVRPSAQSRTRRTMTPKLAWAIARQRSKPSTPTP